MVVIDTHCHASPYWYEPVEILMDQMYRHGVDKAVLVQINGWFDNSYAIECMRRFPGRFSVVVVVDTDDRDAPDRLEEWVEQGAEGVRLWPITRSPGRDSFAIWKKANELNIPVSCVGTIGQYADPEFELLIERFPDLRIIIEHLGGVGGQIGEGDTTPPHDTYRKVLALSKFPNVYMKVPGLGEIATRAMPVRTPFPFDDAPPLIEMAIEAFGATRLMWGSDFPPSAGREGYGNALRLPMQQVGFVSLQDRDWVFGKTAATLWKFGE